MGRVTREPLPGRRKRRTISRRRLWTSLKQLLLRALVASKLTNCCALVASKFLLLFFIFIFYFICLFVLCVITTASVGGWTPQPTRKGDRTCVPPVRGHSPTRRTTSHSSSNHYPIWSAHVKLHIIVKTEFQ